MTRAEAVVIDGKEVIPAGTTGQGQIVHAAKSGWGGKAGELIVAVRYIDYNGVHIPLRRFRINAKLGTRNGNDDTGQIEEQAHRCDHDHANRRR